MTKPVLVSLFSGAGGLDLGFKKAGFQIAWANEYDKSIGKTFRANFPRTTLDQRSIVDIPSAVVPDCDGIIGGPPCQSWSVAGKQRGIKDNRGRLFFEYIRILKYRKPKFFLVENVPGLLFHRNRIAFRNITSAFNKAGYILSVCPMNAANYQVPQDRKRVIIVGFRKDLKLKFNPPAKIGRKPNLEDAIGDLRNTAVKTVGTTRPNPKCKVANHEYSTTGYSYIFMSRNRVRHWPEQSFTIQASARQAPIHPDAPKMIKKGKDRMVFKHGHKNKYRRLTVRECARIQTFPDTHKFLYETVMNGYKMVGNAVPVKLAAILAIAIRKQLKI